MKSALKWSVFTKAANGTSAVEFALIAPVFMFIAAAIVGYGLLFMTSVSLHQLGADAARATIGGLSLAEKTSLAEEIIADNASDYVLLEDDRLTLSVSYSADTQVTIVTVDYDPLNHPIHILEGILPIPDGVFSVSQSITEHRE